LPRILTFTARAPLPKSNADVTVVLESGTDLALIVNSPLKVPRATENEVLLPCGEPYWLDVVRRCPLRDNHFVTVESAA